MSEKWAGFMADGDAYLKTARGGQRRPGVFTPEILYNLLAMAIEKHMMAALIFKGTLADNHAFTDLINSARVACPIDEAIATKLVELERYQDLCPIFDGYNRAEFPADKVAEMLHAAEEVQLWAKQLIAA